MGGWLDIDFSITWPSACHGYFSIHRISRSLLTVDLLDMSEEQGLRRCGLSWCIVSSSSDMTDLAFLLDIWRGICVLLHKILDSIFIIIVFAFIYGFYINYLKLITYSTLQFEVLDPFRPCQVFVLPSYSGSCRILSSSGFMQNILLLTIHPPFYPSGISIFASSILILHVLHINS